MSEDYPRAISTQESHSFDVDIIGHRKNRLIAFSGANHRQTNAGIPLVASMIVPPA